MAIGCVERSLGGGLGIGLRGSSDARSSHARRRRRIRLRVGLARDGLTTALDDIQYNELRKLLREAPW